MCSARHKDISTIIKHSSIRLKHVKLIIFRCISACHGKGHYYFNESEKLVQISVSKKAVSDSKYSNDDCLGSFHGNPQMETHISFLCKQGIYMFINYS